MRYLVAPLLGLVLVLASTLIYASPRLESRFNAWDPRIDGGNVDGTMIDGGSFQIPNTPLKVGLNLLKIVDPEALFALLNATQLHVAAQLAASGDSQLPPSREPFWYNQNQGVWLEAQSVTWRNQHLLWSMLNDTLSWLIPHLAPVSQFGQGGSLTVQHDTWGFVGWIRFMDGFRSEGLGVEVLQGNAGVDQWQ